MGNERAVVVVEGIERSILVIRGHKVMLDRDLAALYGVPTAALKRAVRRNAERFPGDFMFVLAPREFADWRCHFVTSNSDRMGLRHAPMAFTEQGVAMLSSVLHSRRAAQVNIAIMRAFVRMRQVMTMQKGFAEKLAELEKRVGMHDVALRAVVESIKKLAVLPDELEYPPPPEKLQIGFKVGESAAAYRRRKAKCR